MTVNFFKNLSDNKTINKNIQATISNINCVLKDDTSVINPIIILDYNTDFVSSNYCWLSEFERFYYIDNIIYSQQRIFLYLSIDVLMSFKDDILDMECTIERQSNIFDTYLKDNEFLVEGYSRIQTMNFPYGLNNQECYLLMTNGSSIIDNGGNEDVS